MKFKFRSYDFVKNIIESYENEEILDDFLKTFNKDEDIIYKNYSDFCIKYLDDMGDLFDIDVNWDYYNQQY